MIFNWWIVVLMFFISNTVYIKCSRITHILRTAVPRHLDSSVWRLFRNDSLISNYIHKEAKSKFSDFHCSCWSNDVFFWSSAPLYFAETKNKTSSEAKSKLNFGNDVFHIGIVLYASETSAMRDWWCFITASFGE